MTSTTVRPPCASLPPAAPQGPLQAPPRALACALLGLLLVAWAPGARPDDDAIDAPRFEDCTIGEGRARVTAECARVAVPLDHDDPGAGTLELAVARLRATRGGTDGSAFTMIAGGPGQSAIDSWPGVAFAFRHVARDHDVILVDQRGTGDSARLDCPETGAVAGGELERTLDTDPEEIARLARECLAGLDRDPRLFTTSVAVRDLEAVRARLDIPDWHLYGVSYGTRVAQHYARRHPERVRTLILDAVVPPDRALGPDIAPFADRALTLVFDRCAAGPDCASRFPDIEARTRRWLDELARAPRDVGYEDMASGEERRETFSAADLAALLRLSTYSAQTAALMPSMLDDAIERGHLAPLVRQAALQGESLEESLASGMHHAVVCTEDAPRYAADAAEASRDTYLGPSLVEALRASCRDWPAGRLDADFFDPLAVDVPTLVLSGEADPITPPAYGERVAAALPRARHVVNPGQGHMQAPLGCVPVLIARFVAAGGLDEADTACLERLAPPPFFVDANGPLP